jgi:hypothetical protein
LTQLLTREVMLPLLGALAQLKPDANSAVEEGLARL